MTCREKLKIDHPSFINKNFYDKCPHHYGYLARPDYCDNGINRINCKYCWNRELPGEAVNKQDPWRDIYRIIEEGMAKRDREVHIYINPETGISVNMVPWPDMEEQYQDSIQHSSTKDKDVETLFKKSIWTEKEG